MPNIDFQQLFDSLKKGVSELAIAEFKKYTNEAQADALNLMDKVKDNLKTWTQQLSEGKLSKDDIEFLVLGQKDLIEMNALKQVGLAAIGIDDLKDKLLNFIVKTISNLL